MVNSERSLDDGPTLDFDRGRYRGRLIRPCMLEVVAFEFSLNFSAVGTGRIGTLVIPPVDHAHTARQLACAVVCADARESVSDSMACHVSVRKSRTVLYRTFSSWPSILAAV